MLPGLPMEVGYYLRMDLSLSPNEMFDTSKDLFDTAAAYQNSRDEGLAKARQEHAEKQEKERERERKQRESKERLMQKAGLGS